MDGKRSLAECLSYVMEHFLSEWKEKTDKKDSSYRALVEARDYLRDFFKDEGYEAKASFGMQYRTHVPWLCLNDPNLGKGASCGLYISYLFEADMGAVHLALCQGSRYWEDLLASKKKALTLLDGFSDRLFRAFGNGGERKRIDIKEGLFHGAKASQGYAPGTVFSIRYPRGTLRDDVLLEDLRRMDSLYRRMVDEISSMDAYKRLVESYVEGALAEEGLFLLPIDEAEERIDRALAPAGGWGPHHVGKDVMDIRPEEAPRSLLGGIPPSREKLDYLERARERMEVGLMGEGLALRYERKRLSLLGRGDLAEKIKWASRESDSLGFDILSFEGDGRRRLIEVKSTKEGADCPFFLSRNELRVSRKEKGRYWLYRVIDCYESPRMYSLRGALDEGFLLDPHSYLAYGPRGIPEVERMRDFLGDRGLDL